MLFGVFGKEIEVKNQIEINRLSFPDADITDGFTVTVPPAEGDVRFNRVSFSYSTSAAVRAVFRYRQGFGELSEEML
ncbi:MAG: hypothetical protein IKS04_03825, partial [Clostridia bacterium]|nr:hypothetical protein [Clostridia bacterium]